MKPTRGQIITAFFCLLPLFSMLLAAFTHHLSANPIQDLTLRSGRAAVLLLVLSLACTPLKNLFGLTALLPVRKTLGLYSFLYVLIHFLVFAGLDFEFNLAWILDEIAQKPFIKIGLIALVLLVPLAITSIQSIQQRMGLWWGRLHRLVYLIAGLSIWHYYRASKGDILIPLIYALIFGIFMLMRIPPLSKISISSKPGWLKSANQFMLR